MPSHGLIRQFPDLFSVEAGLALERRALSAAPRWTGWPISTRNADADRSRSCKTSTARTRACGDGAGACSSSPPPACSATGGGEVWGVSHYRLKPAQA